MNARRLLPLLLASLLAMLLLGAPPASAHAAPTAQAPQPTASNRDPSKDFATMPRTCASRKDRIPLEPVVCYLNRFHDDRPSIVLWGDSHAWMFIPALKRAIEGEKVNLIATVMGGCPPMDLNLSPAESRASGSCIKNNELALKLTKRLQDGDQPLRIVIAAQWQRYLHALRIHDTESYAGIQAARFKTATPRLFRTLGARHTDVDVVGQVATVPERHKNCRRSNEPYACNLPRHASLQEFKSTRSWLVGKMRPLPGSAAPVNVNRTLCARSTCRGYVKGIYTWFDDLHLSASMSTYLATYFARTVRAVVPQGPGPVQPPPPSCPLPVLC